VRRTVKVRGVSPDVSDVGDLERAPVAVSARRVAAALAVSAVAGLAVAAVGLVGGEAAVPVGAVVSGLSAVLGGLAVAHRAVPALAPSLRLRLRRPQLFGLLIGAAAVVWGAGQLLLGLLVPRGAQYPTAGDVLSALAGPLAVAALALAPRRAAEPLAGLRLTMDGLLTGAAAAALVWRLGFLDRVDAGSALVGATIILVVLSVAALLFIAALRELDRGMVLAAAGVAVFVSSDIATQHAVIVPGGTWPWPAMALTCVAWPLVCAGLLHVSAHPPDLTDRQRPADERRRSIGTTVVTTLLFLGVLASLLHDPHLDPATLVLLGVVVAAMAAGGVVQARQSGALLARLGDLAYLDALTGLANRRALLEALRSVEADHRDSPAWLLTVDLDGFKAVNDLLGHAGGDELLVRAAEQLAAASPGALVYRLGGDEFAVLLRGSEAEATQLGDRLVVAVRLAALSVPGVGRIALSGSVGVTAVDDPREPMVALAQSGTAMHAAKAAGRSRCVTYAGEVAAGSERRRLVEVRLREALRLRQLTIHAQPIVRLADGVIAGLEVLARWTDEELGPVSPAEFVEIAEASSLIVPLGDQVLDMAVRAAADLQVDARDITLGINVSPVQLRVPGFADAVLARLAAHGVPPARIVVEVTEQVFVAENDAAELELARLVAGGVVVAVDDFGSGAASLGYLRRIPARILKLDRSLVASMLRDPRSAAIVTSMTWLGRETGLDVLAEGIEDEATADACRAAGMPFAQGWLWSRAVPLDQVDGAITALGGAPRPGAPAVGVSG
jgi:diguanylate cyclase (GGDEF)-like protein